MEYTEERLAEVQEELNAALKEWTDRGLHFEAWRMGDQELLFRVELLVIMDIIRDRLEVPELEMNIRLKEHLIKLANEMFGPVNELRREAARQQIVDGVFPFRPPQNPEGN
jgi:hypothetical protein